MKCLWNYDEKLLPVGSFVRTITLNFQSILENNPSLRLRLNELATGRVSLKFSLSKNGELKCISQVFRFQKEGKNLVFTIHDKKDSGCNC